MSARKTFKAWQELPAWGTAEEPPAEFLLFPIGESKATHFPGSQRSTVYLLESNCRAIVAEF